MVGLSVVHLVHNQILILIDMIFQQVAQKHLICMLICRVRCHQIMIRMSLHLLIAVYLIGTILLQMDKMAQVSTEHFSTISQQDHIQ